VEAAVATATPSRLTRLKRWEGLPYWLTLPTVAYLVIFFAWPMIQAFELAVREGGSWTLAPYRTMYHDTNFGIAVRFTLIFIVLIIPIQFMLALTMALVVNSDIRFAGIFLFIFILPLGASDLATGLIWSSVFTQHGYLNTVLQDLGLMSHPYIWLNPNHQFLIVAEVVVAEIWRSTALITVILIAGMQGIPKEYGEAADVFGASFFARLRYVTLPMLKPAIRVALLLRIIFAFEVFGTVLAIGGSTTTTLAAQAYNWETALLNPHVAAAYASLILVLSLAAAAIVLLIFRTPREQLAR
jgi:multiple sugar transport system permease protein